MRRSQSISNGGREVALFLRTEREPGAGSMIVMRWEDLLDSDGWKVRCKSWGPRISKSRGGEIVNEEMKASSTQH